MSSVFRLGGGGENVASAFEQYASGNQVVWEKSQRIMLDGKRKKMKVTVKTENDEIYRLSMELSNLQPDGCMIFDDLSAIKTKIIDDKLTKVFVGNGQTLNLYMYSKSSAGFNDGPVFLTVSGLNKTPTVFHGETEQE